MRQEEEWEQVIQGLWGPGRAQVSAGVGGVQVCESRAVRQGEAPSSSHRSSGEVGAWEPSTRHCSISCGAQMGGAVDFAPPTRCGREAEQSAGHNSHQGRKRRVGVRTGHIWVRSGDLTWMASTETPCDGFCSIPPLLGMGPPSLAVGVSVTVILPA